MHVIEDEAEFLLAHQLDLLVQLESQLRAVRKTMAGTHTLRQQKYRVGPELTDGEQGDAMAKLGSAIEDIDGQLQVQHASCEDMLTCIRTMQARLLTLRRVSQQRIQFKAPSGQNDAQA
jgi:hypothetical protein